MEIAVLHDFNVNKGGGDFVMLSILEALNTAGYTVTLVTSKNEGPEETVRLFNRHMDRINVLTVETPKFLRHPYTIAYAAGKIAKKYDLLILSDDVPKCLSNRKVMCYVHYSHAARLKFEEYITERHTTTLKGKVAFWIHRKLFPIFYPTKNISNNWLFIANSELTKEHTSRTLHPEDDKITLLHPPVSSGLLHNLWKQKQMEKEDLIVCIGRFEPSKRLEDLVHALSLLESKVQTKLSLIGFTYDRIYLEKLIKTIEDLGLESRVELALNAERAAVLDRLLRAKVLVHLSPREPFGIAVVEGMAVGCIPIVRKGVNGPWMEIIEKGKYGLGFDTVDELGCAIEKAVMEYGSFNREAIVAKALEFEEAKFKNRFLKICKDFSGRTDS